MKIKIIRKKTWTWKNEIIECFDDLENELKKIRALLEELLKTKKS